MSEQGTKPPADDDDGGDGRVERDLFACSDTARSLAASGKPLANRPMQSATLDAIQRLERDLLQPIESRFGPITITYGFAGRELTKAVEKRAKADGRLPNITPRGDQHAGHELNTRNGLICGRGGQAVDLRVPGVATDHVVDWVMDNLPFDRIYRYGGDHRPFHLSWSAQPLGQVIRMLEKAGGLMVPIVVRRGRVPSKS